MDAECQTPVPILITSAGLSTVRLYLLKFIYLLSFIGLATSAWPQFINRGAPWDPLHGVAYSFGAAYGALMLLGVRFPRRMLPLLSLQPVYKLTWLVGVGYPLWSARHLTPAASGLIRICAVGVVVDLTIIPWPYVFANYVKGVFTRGAKEDWPAR